MSNIIVVGGSGYIGRHLQQKRPEYIYISSKDFDINNKENITLYLKKKQIDICIILAAKIGYDRDLNLMQEPFQTNVNGLNNLLHVLSLKSPHTKIVYFSSMTVYDANNKSPVSESQKLLPLHGYGLSKVWAESLINYYQFPSLIIRIPGVYGGDRKQGYIYNTIKMLQSGADIEIDTQSLGYWETIHIDDLIFSFDTLMKKYQFNHKVEVYNISYGEPTDFIETALFIKTKIASAGKIKIDKKYKSFYLCNKKLLSHVTLQNTYYDKLKLYIEEVL